MRFLQLDTTRNAPTGAFAMALMRAIGAEDFAAQLMAALGMTLPTSHCTVFSLRGDGRVDAISAASSIGEVATLTTADYMRMGFDKKDVNMVWLSKRKVGGFIKLWIAHQMAEQVADEEYRLMCYGQVGIRERLSLLLLSPQGVRVAVNLYRNLSFENFSDDDFSWLKQNAALIGSAVERHMHLAKRERPAQQMSPDVVSRLSGRERQLFSLVMSGLTTKAAALSMGVSETTALTYRYRVFRRFGVRSLRELMALSIG